MKKKIFSFEKKIFLVLKKKILKKNVEKKFGEKNFEEKVLEKTFFPNFGTVCRRLVNMLTQRMLMTDLNSFQSINLSQFFDSVKFRSGSGLGYHLVIDFCIVMFYMLMILMKFSFVPQTFFRIRFILGSGSGSWTRSGLHYAIHWRKLFFIC